MNSLNFKRLESAALAAWKPVQKGFDRLKPVAREFGKALIALRSECKKRGQFMAWLRENRIDENRAMYCLRLVQGKVKTKPANRLNNNDEPTTPTLTLEPPARMMEALSSLAFAWGDEPEGIAVHLLERAFVELPDVREKLEELGHSPKKEEAA